jgi:Zn-dependent protease
VTTALSVLLVLNVFVGLFNLLPVPPLDGFAVFRIFLPDHHAARLRALESNSMMSMLGLVVAWQIFPAFTDPLFSMLLKMLHPGVSYS